MVRLSCKVRMGESPFDLDRSARRAITNPDAQLADLWTGTTTTRRPLRMGERKLLSLRLPLVFRLPCSRYAVAANARRDHVHQATGNREDQVLQQRVSVQRTPCDGWITLNDAVVGRINLLGRRASATWTKPEAEHAERTSEGRCEFRHASSPFRQMPNDRGSPEKTRADAGQPSTTVPAAFSGASAC